MLHHGWVPICRTAFWGLIETFPECLRLGARSLWLEILMRARQRPGTVEGQVLARGQLVFGEERMGGVCGLSRQQIRTLLKRSVTMEKLTIKTTSQGSVATVIDFDSYVPPDLLANQQNRQQVTSDQPTINHIQQGTRDKGTRTASPSARRRDDYMDKMMQLWSDCWPELKTPKHSLLSMWRQKFDADDVLDMTTKIGLGGKGFATTQDLTSYLFAALSNQARSHGAASQSLVIADPLGKPITDPDARLQGIIELGAVVDPDQGHWFTLPDVVIAAGDMDDSTREAIIARQCQAGDG